MKDFKKYLDQTGEIGYVAKIVHSIVYVKGLPSAQTYEVVLFENGGMGLVLSLRAKYVEVLLLSNKSVEVGQQVARTNELLQVPLGPELLGKMISPLGTSIKGSTVIAKPAELRPIDSEPMGILGRLEVKRPLETGVKIVDLVVPLGRGQRELVVGDRKTGKTLFLMQTILSQARLGTVCIYASIGKRQSELKGIIKFIKENNITKNTIIVATVAGDPPGLIYLTPYTAMTIAEYFRDQGQDTLVIMDDMSAHASCYREITLLARRFPGRSSYPGDIFYLHAKLMERAGSFEKAAITCLPVAEVAMGDMSGYIQTNLMSMTDGHIYFDIDRYNRGIRPAINPFLSVTRVGLQAQSPLVRDLNRQLSSFLVHLEDLKDFMHFGAEVSESLKNTLNLGARVEALLGQAQLEVIPVNIAIFLLAAIWGGVAKDSGKEQVRALYQKSTERYLNEPEFAKYVNNTLMATPSFSELAIKIAKQEREIFA